MSPVRRSALVVGLLLACQILVGASLIGHRAQVPVLLPAPGLQGALASALGDGEFFFRNGVLKLLNIGVTGGDLIPMKELDYADLSSWFYLLDQLDPRSEIVPHLAAYWYGFTPNRPDARFVIDYLLARAEIDAKHGWRWRVQAMYFAKHRLGDLELALIIAETLAAADDPQAPYWVKHMPAFMMESLGERETALILLSTILEGKADMTADERDALQSAINRLSQQLPEERP